MQDELNAVLVLLESLPSPFPKRVCAGFDAVVDLLTTPVRHVKKNGDRVHFSTIGEFGDYLSARGGDSGIVDVTTLVEKPGGNMVNFSAALGVLGVPVDCVGTLGMPEILPAYGALPAGCNLISVGHSGSCFALEFENGKVMFAQMDRANQLDYEQIKTTLGTRRLAALFGGAALTGLLNWSEVLASTGIWKGLLADVYAQAPPDKGRYILFDLTDFSRLDAALVLEAVSLLGEFSRYRATILSLNQNEARLLGEILGLPAGLPFEALTGQLWEKLNVDRVVVHPNDGAFGTEGGGVQASPGFYAATPVVSTGGGDNFNAGLSLGLLAGLPLNRAMLLGNVISGCYVRLGRSPTAGEAAGFIREQLLRAGEVRA